MGMFGRSDGKAEVIKLVFLGLDGGKFRHELSLFHKNLSV